MLSIGSTNLRSPQASQDLAVVLIKDLLVMLSKTRLHLDLYGAQLNDEGIIMRRSISSLIMLNPGVQSVVNYRQLFHR